MEWKLLFDFGKNQALKSAGECAMTKVKYGDVDLTLIHKLLDSINGPEVAKQIIRGEIVLAYNNEGFVRGSMDPVVEVNHGILSDCGSLGKPVFNSPKKHGVSRLDVTKLKAWSNEDFLSCAKTYRDILEYVQVNDDLDRFLDLREIEEIVKRGVEFYVKYFQAYGDRSEIMAWSGLVKRKDGKCYVPCCGPYCDDRVYWRWIGERISSETVYLVR